jgi:microcystin-dependent protein
VASSSSRLGLDEPSATDAISGFPAEDVQALGVLDNAVIITQGTLTSRPAASAVAAGNEYHATDVGQWARSDGTAWHTYLAAGDLRNSAAATPPTGWLLCDGRSYTQSTYPSLFAAIGTTYGGGSGIFNVPDYRGRTVIGVGSGTGGNASAHALGEEGGDEDLQNHAHGVADPGHYHTFASYDLSGLGGGDTWAFRQVAAGAGYWMIGSESNTPTNLVQIENTTDAGTGVSVNAAGSGGSQNMQPFGVANVMIKT